MARQVLENGVILPAEYSDDWYDDMTSNLTKLDDVIGSDSEKLSSSDVGAAALSNNYNDLDNLPTIPTVNDATLTIQKNGVDVETFTANASSNVTCNITVPTKTSDLTNDSNFVDTSNSAVASGITSAKVTDYDTHIADTDIHVTTADKNKWNNQTYVFRYSSTALTPSSTNSNALLDNTDNLKVGDKVIDSSGVLFSITAIDTQNSTFTIGTALIDLANDSDVVHKSGNETIVGYKVFENICLSNSIKAINLENQTIDLNSCYSSFGLPQSGNISFYFCNTNNGTANISNLPEQSAFFLISQSIRILSGGSIVYAKQTLVNSNGKTFVRYCNNSVWDSWQNVTNLVTTDTAQTISGNKTFSDSLTIYNSDSSQATKNLTISSSKIQVGDTSNSDAFGIVFNAGLSYVSRIMAFKDTAGTQNLQFGVRTKDSSNNLIGAMIRLRSYANGFNSFESDGDNLVSLGSSSNRWKNVQTYKVNALEPSSLSLPSGNANDVIDISSYITALDGTSNSYTVPANGWISIAVVGTAIAIISSSWSDSRLRGSSGDVRMLYPVLKNEILDISVIGNTLAYARFIPCQGNV